MATKIGDIGSRITEQINKRIRFESKIILDQEDPIIEEGALIVVTDDEGNNFLIIGEGNKYSNTPILMVDREEEINDLNDKISDIVEVLRNFNKILYVTWISITLLFIGVIILLLF